MSDIFESMTKREIASGVVHKVPPDLRKPLMSDAKALAAWEDISPIARNEWLCWIESAKNRRRGRAGSRGRARSLVTESAGLVVGRAALIVEIS